MKPELKHHCGIALLVLRSNNAYSKLNALPIFRFIIMLEKQRNRGQDGGGIVALNPQAPPSVPLYRSWKSLNEDPVSELISRVSESINRLTHLSADPINGPVFIGHLRYGTYGDYAPELCQPVIISSPDPRRTFFFAGNFNLTSILPLVNLLRRSGLRAPYNSDSHIVAYSLYSELEEKKDIAEALKNISTLWDGGWAFTGGTGIGKIFVCRDFWGIRPAYYVFNNDFFAVASERPALLSALPIGIEEINEVPPGKALIYSYLQDRLEIVQLKTPPLITHSPPEKKACSFERIYFSRGSDPDIYRERYRLGAELAMPVINTIGKDFDPEEVAFSYVPNTAEVAFIGLTDTVEKLTGKRVKRVKLLFKDTKLRTFIAREGVRQTLVSHVYDITWFRPGYFKTLVIIDDSIVRGTTLKESILKILAKLQFEEIIFVSSAPQIRFPDFYGIDMSKLQELVAFQAAITKLKESSWGKELIEETFEKCKEYLTEFDINGKYEPVNHVKNIYGRFTAEEISELIAELVTPPELNSRLKIIYQSIEGLHRAIPEHKGDWYFTGDYPTPGGMRLIHKNFIDFVEHKNKRPYELEV